MKVTAYIGSTRKKHTHHASVQFLQKLKSLGGIDLEKIPENSQNPLCTR